jgi:DNA polymerase III beta subunit, central domain
VSDATPRDAAGVARLHFGKELLANRRARAIRTLEFPHSHERDFIVPTKAVTELQRLLGEEGEVQISVGENLVK